MLRIRLLCTVLLFSAACAHSHNSDTLGEIQQELQVQRKLVEETNAELKAMREALEPMLEMAAMMGKFASPSGQGFPGATGARGPHAGSRPGLHGAGKDSDTTELDGLIASDLHKLSDTHVTITRALFDKAISNPDALARGARLVPSIKGGKANGLKLYAIRPDSIYAKLGFLNGDTVHRINGHSLSTPDEALESYTSLKDSTKFEIEITRRGASAKLTIDIK